MRTRRYISKFYNMKTQLQAVSLRLQTLRSNQQMAEAMKGATRVRGFSAAQSRSHRPDTRFAQAMSMMSRQMNLPQIQRILQEFERESSQMDMKEEMMGESIDDAMDENEGETEEEEGNKILEEVLAEIGINVEQQVRGNLEETLSFSVLRCLIMLRLPFGLAVITARQRSRFAACSNCY